MYKIIETTDKKFIGITIETKPFVGMELSAEESSGTIEKVVEFGNYVQVSNSNYVILFKRVDQ